MMREDAYSPSQKAVVAAAVLLALLILYRGAARMFRASRGGKAPAEVQAGQPPMTRTQSPPPGLPPVAVSQADDKRPGDALPPGLPLPPPSE